MPKVEQNTREVIARLEREGWRSIGGARHEKFSHSAFPGMRIMVPRHRSLSVGVALDIAKKAGWL
ncbi:type II toxin-antitoxin system HicA family toxin [Alsobacter sp. KACC 23698]|uniref:Type II toxin-antitoxin system HicA family toxin n=1 Tax=Alsobacter sp. KACC 23698 TaxID=3149229 RepID=A0AAU7JCJ1_9HYPH